MVGASRGPGAAVRTLFDHHIHTDRSDGRISLADRGATAASLRHGVSDHFPYRASLQTDDDVLRYQDDAARLGMRVGLEYDLGVAPRLLPAKWRKTPVRRERNRPLPACAASAPNPPCHANRPDLRAS